MTLGHYSVGTKRFLSKSVAALAALQSGGLLRYEYDDEIFDRCDWTVEPEPQTPIDEFYRRRAQQLRDNYDYIVLQYSGGPDSQNVLDAFLDNGIKLDEVVNFNTLDSTQVLEGTTHNLDYFYNVRPMMTEIGDRSKVTIIDEIDMTKKVWKEYSKRDYFELLFNAGTFPSVWMSRGIWIKHVPHIWEQFTAGKRVCVVLGVDKTRLDLTNGKYSVAFSDLIGCDPTNLFDNDPEFAGKNVMEYFYHTADSPFLVIKQAHTLKKYAEAADESCFEDTYHYKKRDHRPATMCLSKKFPGKFLRYDHYHRTVYPKWRANIITPKPLYLANRAIDCWWVDALEDTEKRVWTLGINKYYQDFGSLLSKRQFNTTTLPLVFTKARLLE